MNPVWYLWFSAFLLAVCFGIVVGVMYTRWSYRQLYEIGEGPIYVLRDGVMTEFREQKKIKKDQI